MLGVVVEVKVRRGVRRPKLCMSCDMICIQHIHIPIYALPIYIYT